ncbi:hypothetical protein ASPVEDRAFT_26078 [Aspergillus versicolor CBS 583.65]|uniref:Uncharacterized protein n=1 Tax=Aspergillus versicolor CBS 583.65 TaxID=1036611 RepID=A0A1L9PCR8_ASPVE|nr:uncharacterized protein ASPVEDRAFT_26078 [Aspergillus versicolor CBS 583.65]OJI99254.1 hypothetical protein ASPVEDRAFT_26078 [Aspergillus versicolor CBS 583.65]
MAQLSSPTSSSCSLYSPPNSSSLSSDHDTDSELPILPPQYTLLEQDQAAGSVFPVLHGVTSGDLPAAPLGTKNPVLKHYLSRPVRRHLDWKEKANGTAIRKPLDGVLAIQAGFIQTRGEIAQAACTSCSKGKGVWKTCVVGNKIGRSKPSNEVCANCLFSKSWACSQPSGTSDAEPSGSSTSKDPRGRTIARNSSGRRAQTPFPRRTATAVDLTSPDLSRQNSASVQNDTPIFQGRSLPDPMILPEAVVEFPLSATTFNNLPVLKRALSDMGGHIGKIKMRIRQLERMQMGYNSGNPWDSL